MCKLHFAFVVVLVVVVVLGGGQRVAMRQLPYALLGGWQFYDKSNLIILKRFYFVFITNCGQLHKLNVYMLVHCRLCAVLYNDLKSGGNADLHLTIARF